MTEHIRYVQMILINEDSWNKISPEDQEVVAQCIKEAGEYATQLRNDKEQDMYNDMKTTSQVEIISLTDAQRQEFADAVSGLYSENMSIWGQEAYDDLIIYKVYRGK
jgi:C4-dicarboxylate-binding protein DctP